MATRSARELLSDVIGEELAQRVDEKACLRTSGVGSGELIRLSLMVEDALDRPLDEDELLDLDTLADLQDLLDSTDLERP